MPVFLSPNDNTSNDKHLQSIIHVFQFNFEAKLSQFAFAVNPVTYCDLPLRLLNFPGGYLSVGSIPSCPHVDDCQVKGGDDHPDCSVSTVHSSAN